MYSFPMTKEEFYAEARKISEKAGVLDGLHQYFLQAGPRIHYCNQLFGLYGNQLGDVLEIGPFYGYTPFVLKANTRTYTVIEGSDPVINPLMPLYAEAGIQCTLVDLSQTFGNFPGASMRFSIPDASYDTILCWETMEHFNFNPVKFIRELHRILKPGGKVCITVPNRASFQNMVSYLFGRGEKYHVDSFFTFENYEGYLGFHWHEYTSSEAAMLFQKAGFQVEKYGTFAAFQGGKKVGLLGKMARALSKAATAILPRYGTNVYLMARK